MVPLLKQLHQSQQIDIELVPAQLQEEVDKTNDWIYTQINNGAYQCGFATSQQAYDRASVQVLQGLNRAETIFSQHSYLCGEIFTESDIFLLPTMLRFDSVYAPLFGAGGSRHWRLASDFPHIHRWMKQCWNEIPGVADSIDLDDATKSYYKQLFPLNPGGIVPSVEITPKRLGLE
jgi:putative glutathione S-transferase